MKNINILLLAVTFLGGCAVSQVAPDQRDRSGAYAGNWRGTLALTRPIQPSGNISYTCSRFSVPMRLEVSDGFVSGAFDESTAFKTPVDSAGRFSGEVATDGSWNNDGGVAGSLGNITYYVRGRFDPGQNRASGVFIIGSRNKVQGCRAEFELTRQNT